MAWSSQEVRRQLVATRRVQLSPSPKRGGGDGDKYPCTRAKILFTCTLHYKVFNSNAYSTHKHYGKRKSYLWGTRDVVSSRKVLILHSPPNSPSATLKTLPNSPSAALKFISVDWPRRKKIETFHSIKFVVWLLTKSSCIRQGYHSALYKKKSKFWLALRKGSSSTRIQTNHISR